MTSHHGRLRGLILLSAGVIAAAVSTPALGAGRSTGGARTLAASHHHAKIASVHTALGRVVANPKGRVMFRFLKDGHNTSACKASCQAVWPPVMSSGRPHAAAHIRGSHLGRTRSGQATYYGHPLYYYVADPHPGKTVGDGTKEFGDHWYVVSTAGRSVKPAPSGPRGAAEVSTAMVGTTEVLTSRNGHTLYELSSEHDSPPAFTCTSSCRSIWPPLLTNGPPTASGDAMASLLGTVTRPDGTIQVTYNHHPLYDYSGDTAAGTAHGEGQYDPPGYWYDLTPNGAPN